MKKMSFLTTCSIALVALAAWAPDAGAFPVFAPANCWSCHSQVFSGSKNSIGHQVHLGLGLPDSCNTCHISVGDNPPMSNCVQCHVQAGLVAHHENADVLAGCGGCHPGLIADPENTRPPGYDTITVAALDPCDGSEELFGPNVPLGAGSFTVSLDNDGDLLYDGADPDCDVGCTVDADCGDGMFCDAAGICMVLPSPGNDDVVIDFGAIGLWARMNDASWLKLNNTSPDQVVTGDMDGNGADDVIAVFSTGIFVKRNLGGWLQLHNSIPELMAVGDLDDNGKDDVVIDFGGIGLWARMNDASWLKLNNTSPDQVVTGDMDGNGADDIIAVFSSGIFVKRNLGGWLQLHNFVPEQMTIGDLDSNGKDDVVIDFGGIALWARMNDSAWLKLHNSSPELVATGDLDGNGADDVLATFFDLGLWQKLNLGGWGALSSSVPDEVVTGDVNGSSKDDIIADFGSTLGGIYVKRDQGDWVKLHNTSPDSMAPGELD